MILFTLFIIFKMLFSALSGRFEEMQYNEVGDFEETPDVSELEALKRSSASTLVPVLTLLAIIAIL